jgi:hypothetical protein
MQTLSIPEDYRIAAAFSGKRIPIVPPIVFAEDILPLAHNCEMKDEWKSHAEPSDCEPVNGVPGPICR